MRQYAKVSPQLWTGDLGMALQGRPELQSLAVYLITSPHAHMSGLYRLPLSYIAADLGCDRTPLKGWLEELERLGFCRYDFDQQRVWVVEMLRHEIDTKTGPKLGQKDNRTKALQRGLKASKNSVLAREFFDHYRDALPDSFGDILDPFEAPPAENGDPLRTQEQEQEQETEQEQERETRARATPANEPTTPEEFFDAAAVAGEPERDLEPLSARIFDRYPVARRGTLYEIQRALLEAQQDDRLPDDAVCLENLELWITTSRDFADGFTPNAPKLIAQGRLAAPPGPEDLPKRRRGGAHAATALTTASAEAAADIDSREDSW